MHGASTPGFASSRAAVRAVEVTRAQAIALVLLLSIPVPLLSLGALLAPLPQTIQRGAAHFLPFVSRGAEQSQGPVVLQRGGPTREAPARSAPAPTQAPRVSERSRPRHAPLPSAEVADVAAVQPSGSTTTPSVATPMPPAPSATPTREPQASAAAPTATSTERVPTPVSSAPTDVRGNGKKKGKVEGETGSTPSPSPSASAPGQTKDDGESAQGLARGHDAEPPKPKDGEQGPPGEGKKGTP